MEQEQPQWGDGLRVDDPLRQPQGGTEQLGERIPVAEGVDPDIFGPGVARVPANHPLPGPGRNIFTGRSSTRSQSPGGPRAFLQGLFGLGRDDVHGQDQSTSRPVAITTTAPHAPPPQPPPPRPPHSTSQVPGAQDDHLLTTLVKGIEALLRQQQTARNDRPETVKPGITELPHLPEYQPSTGSIDLLHWLTHISPIMEDLSDTSLAWWQETMKEAMAWYSEYESASPLARLQLQPRPSVELRPEWARVERRATAMMLTAIPKPIREEIIAHGQVSSLVVLCKLYSVYQPGNLQEKTLVLRMLELKDCASGVCGGKELCRWAWQSRTRQFSCGGWTESRATS